MNEPARGGTAHRNTYTPFGKQTRRTVNIGRLPQTHVVMVAHIECVKPCACTLRLPDVIWLNQQQVAIKIGCFWLTQRCDLGCSRRWGNGRSHQHNLIRLP